MTSRLRPSINSVGVRLSVARRSLASVAAAVQPNETSFSQPFFPGEPAGPTVRTAFPGPKSQAAIKDLDTVFDTRSLNMIANYQQSFGNYITDPDGNVLLDV